MVVREDIQQVYKSDQYDTYSLSQQARDKCRYWSKGDASAPKTYRNSDGVTCNVRTKEPLIDYSELASLAASLV